MEFFPRISGIGNKAYIRRRKTGQSFTFRRIMGLYGTCAYRTCILLLHAYLGMHFLSLDEHNERTAKAVQIGTHIVRGFFLGSICLREFNIRVINHACTC